MYSFYREKKKMSYVVLRAFRRQVGIRGSKKKKNLTIPARAACNEDVWTVNSPRPPPAPWWPGRGVSRFTKKGATKHPLGIHSSNTTTTILCTQLSSDSFACTHGKRGTDTITNCDEGEPRSSLHWTVWFTPRGFERQGRGRGRGGRYKATKPPSPHQKRHFYESQWLSINCLYLGCVRVSGRGSRRYPLGIRSLLPRVAQAQAQAHRALTRNNEPPWISLYESHTRRKSRGVNLPNRGIAGYHQRHYITISLCVKKRLGWAQLGDSFDYPSEDWTRNKDEEGINDSCSCRTSFEEGGTQRARR